MGEKIIQPPFYNTGSGGGSIPDIAEWENITSKIGHLDTSVVGSNVIILLNRSLQMVDISGWAEWGTLRSSTQKMFHFNSDLPSDNSDRLFSGDIVARDKPDYNAGLVSVRPYPFSDTSQEWAISCRRDTVDNFSFNYCDSWWRILMISPTRKEAFYQYLDNH